MFSIKRINLLVILAVLVFQAPPIGLEAPPIGLEAPPIGLEAPPINC